MSAPSTAEPTSRRARRGRWVWRLTLAVALGIALLEGSARLLGVAPAELAAPRVEPQGYSPFVRGPGGLAVYRPNARFRCVYDPAGDTRGYFGSDGGVDYALNGFGMRGPECSLEKAAGTTRVLCLGDSFTFGEGVREADSWPARLGALLAGDDSPVEVLNAGVQAFGTLETAALFEAHLQRFDPDVVVLGFFLNDASPYEETIRHHQRQAQRPPRSWLAERSHAWRAFEHRRASSRRREEWFDALRASFSSPRWEECQRALGRLQEAAEREDSRLVVLVFPVLWGLDGAYPFDDLHAEVARACAALGCERIDLLEEYRGRPAPALWAHPTDHHPNELAHALAAERVARALKPLR